MTDDGQIDVAMLGAGLAAGVAGAYYRPFGSAVIGFFGGTTLGAIGLGLARMATQAAMPQEVVVLDMGMASAADTRMPPPTGG